MFTRRLLNATTKVAPALAYGNGTLLVAWVDKDRKLHLWPAADDETSSASRNLHYADETWYLTWAGGALVPSHSIWSTLTSVTCGGPDHLRRRSAACLT